MNTPRGHQSAHPELGTELRVPVEPVAVVRAEDMNLSRSMTIAQGFHAIVANCVMQIRGNEAGVAHGQDPESVHQMRVGLRRLRSVHRLFRDVAVPSATLQKDIEWLSSQLSVVRDWEVLANSTLPAIEAEAARDTALPALRAAVIKVAKAQRKKASSVVKSARFARFGKALSAWEATLERQASQAPEGDDSPSIKDFADRMMTRVRKRLLKRGGRLDDIDGNDPEARHRLRIAAKTARYTMEFFQSLYPRKRVKAYAGPLLALQDCLGQLNDFSVAEHLLLELQKSTPALKAGACYVRGYLASSASRQDRKLRKFWRRFESAKLPERQHVST